MLSACLSLSLSLLINITATLAASSKASNARLIVPYAISNPPKTSPKPSQQLPTTLALSPYHLANHLARPAPSSQHTTTHQPLLLYYRTPTHQSSSTVALALITLPLAPHSHSPKPPIARSRRAFPPQLIALGTISRARC